MIFQKVLIFSLSLFDHVLHIEVSQPYIYVKAS